jgi:VWFA-related protein
MMKGKILFLISFLVLNLLLSFHSLNLEGQRKSPELLIQHEVIVTLKLVQVYVTDKKGNPVTDLSSEDFIIYDNGKKQKITDFERHLLPFFLEKLGEKKEAITATQAPPPRQLMTRKFFLLFDFAHNNPRGIIAARKAALDFLEKMVQPTDEIGLLSYSPSRFLAMHEYLTTNHQRIKGFIESLGLKESLGNVENLEAVYWEKVTGQNPLDVSKAGGVLGKEDELSGVARASEEAQRFLKVGESRYHALAFISRMTNLAKALRYVPGIKYILLFSSGIPYSLIYGIQAPWGIRNYEAWGERLIQEKLVEMCRELAASNTVIYAFDTEDSLTRITQDTRMTGAFTLQQLASSTGGKYFGNIKNYDEALEQVQQLTGCYYVLGYYVDEKWDGKYHEIKVEVKRPGVKVYAQRGYFNPKPFKEWSDLERMLHLVDLALSEQPLFQTPLPLRCGGFSYTELGQGNIILWADLVKGELGGLGEGEVELVFLVFDGEGNIVKMGRWAGALARLPEAAIYFSSPLSVPAGDYRCRVVLRSLETGRGAVGSVEMKIGEVKEGGISLGQPFLLMRSEGQRYENFPSFLFPFDLGGFVPLTEVKRGERELYALVMCSYSGVKEPELRLYGELLFLEGEKRRSLPLRFSLLQKARTEAREIYLVKVETEPLEPGLYSLYFQGEEVKSGSRSLSQAVFRVIN